MINKQHPKRKPPALVVFDPSNNTYHRWVGRIRTHSVRALEPMTKEWLEYFRLNPEETINGGGDGGPAVA